MTGGLAAAIAALTGIVGDQGGAGAPGLTCAAFEHLGYAPPGPRELRSDPAIVRQIRAEAADKRLRKRRKRLDRGAPP